MEHSTKTLKPILNLIVRALNLEFSISKKYAASLVFITLNRKQTHNKIYQPPISFSI